MITLVTFCVTTATQNFQHTGEQMFIYHVNYKSYRKDNDEIGYLNTVVCRTGKRAAEVLKSLRDLGEQPVVIPVKR